MDRDPDRPRIRAFQDNVDSIFLTSYNSRNQSEGKGTALRGDPNGLLTAGFLTL